MIHEGPITLGPYSPPEVVARIDGMESGPVLAPAGEQKLCLLIAAAVSHLQEEG